MKEQKETLKPCPFCGGNDLKLNFNMKEYGPYGEKQFICEVRCYKCGATLTSHEWNADPCIVKQGAIRKWNTRVCESEEQRKAASERFRKMWEEKNDRQIKETSDSL